MFKTVPFEVLKGKILKNVIINKDVSSISFITTDEEWYIMEHDQECCEHVFIKEIDNDLSLLIGSPILVAEERIDDSTLPDNEFDYYDSQTWSFYTLRTNQSTSVISWLGMSNGYYSEKVDLRLCVNDKEDEVQKMSEYLSLLSKLNHYSNYENSLIDYFLKIIKDIPIEIYGYQSDDVDQLKHITFTIMNPKYDRLTYKLYQDDQNTFKFDRTMYFDDLTIPKVVKENITWPDNEVIDEFLYKCGRFK